MSYSVNPVIFKSIFAVPTDIVDKHIRLANEHQLKVLLWILRNSTDNPDIDEMCKALKINPNDAADYLQYWILTGVINVDGKTIEVNETPEPQSEVKSNESELKKEAPKSKIAKEKEEEPQAPSRPSIAEILTRLEESPEIGHLFNEAQVKLGKTIGYDGQCTLLLIHDHYGLPTEVIFMMIDYCVSIGKSNYSYLQAVGKDWGLREIDTLEKAAEQISILRNSNSLWKEFAIAASLSNTRPTPKQHELVRQWSEEFKYDIEMIMCAYEAMIDTTGRYNINYLHKVLVSWNEKGYRTPEDAIAGEKEYQESKKAPKKNISETKASYDLDQFKERSLHSELKYERKKKK